MDWQNGSKQLPPPMLATWMKGRRPKVVPTGCYKAYSSQWTELMQWQSREIALKLRTDVHNSARVASGYKDLLLMIQKVV
jgi:hypothetical protein